MSSLPASLTVIIPTLNEADNIGNLLHDLTRQTMAGFKVIVSDSDSGDATRQEAMAYADKLKLQFVPGKRRGPAAARNAGAALAGSRWLLFLDADVRLPDTNFLTRLLEGAQQKGWQTASAVLSTAQLKGLEKMGAATARFYTSLLSHTHHPVALGACILTDADLFKKLGGFDESLAVAEDYDYVSRAGAQAGFGFVKTTSYIYDLRRFRQEGSAKTFLRSVGYELYRFTHHYQIKNDPFNYRFGHHRKK